MKRIRTCIIGVLLVLFVLAEMRGVTAYAALKEYELDFDVYNLYIGETPTDIYDSFYTAGKLTNTSLNVEDYELDLVDDDESQEQLRTAMKTAGLDPTKYKSMAMDVTLYKYDEDEGDYYPVTSSISIDVVSSLPDSFYYYNDEDDYVVDYDNVKVVKLTTAGKLEYVSFSLVSIDEVPCVQFKINSSTPYGFIVPGTNEATPTPTAKPTATPTPKPTATPTPKATATPTPKVTATPTPKQAMSSSTKDDTPQTGDNTPLGAYIALAVASTCVLAGVLKKRK